MSVQVAESVKRPKPKKVLDHLELHPRMGGGHIVKHVYTSYEHEPKEVHFNEEGKSQGGEHVVNHLIKHGGLPVPEGGASAEPEEEEDEE